MESNSRSLDDLDKLIDELTTNARAHNTVRSYDASTARWVEWCESHGLYPMPAEPRTVARFLVDNADSYKLSTLESTLAAVSIWHKQNGFHSPCSVRMEPLRSVWVALKKRYRQEPKQAKAITAENIRTICKNAGDDIRGKRDRALFLIGFAAALRRGELVALTVADIEMTDDGMRISISKSKTDQAGTGATIGIVPGVDHATCPIKALKEWLSASGIKSGHLFRGIDRHGNIKDKGLYSGSVSSIIKKACVAIGLDSDDYSGHSLRAGFVTEAQKNGVPDSSIMRHTRHGSLHDLKPYIRHTDPLAANPTAMIGL